MSTSRRQFLTVLGGSATLAGCRAGTEDDQDRLTTALRELNEAAGIGVTADEFERARGYAIGVYRDVAARLRPLALGDHLDLPVRFSAE
jgi:hypothetical protein